MMTHCARCRADAAGMLGNDMMEAHQILQNVINTIPGDLNDKPYVAVATNEGHLVNLHLGEATHVYIYSKAEKGYNFEGMREMPKPGSGDMRWLEMAKILKDCRALLVSGAGENPQSIITNCGTKVIVMTGMIDEGLEGVYENKPIKSIAKPDAFRCGSGCNGNAQGCA